MRFLVYKGKGNNTEAYEFANRIINQIAEFGLSEIRYTGVADVYKFAINKKLANGQKDEAKEIAKKASEIWQSDKDFLDVTQ